MVIPHETADGKPITEIAAGAFENKGMKSVELPGSLTTIGAKAFAGNELSKVKVPDSITNVAKDAFADNKTVVTLESSNQAVLDKLNAAGLEGVTIKDTSTPKPVIVDKVKVSKITLSGISKKVAAGKKITLKASVYPENADNKALIWTSSNRKVATVDSNGVVKFAKKSGGKKVTITAQAADGSGVLATYQMSSMKGVVKSIKVTGVKSVKAGKSLKLKAKISASKGANSKVVWTSSNEKYAKVSASGKVKTYKAGKGKTVKITVRSTDGSNKKKTVKIKIR